MTAVVLSKLPEVHFQTVFVSLCTTAILAFSTQSFRLCCSIPLSWTKIWPATWPHHTCKERAFLILPGQSSVVQIMLKMKVKKRDVSKVFQVHVGPHSDQKSGSHGERETSGKVCKRRKTWREVQGKASQGPPHFSQGFFWKSPCFPWQQLLNIKVRGCLRADVAFSVLMPSQITLSTGGYFWKRANFSRSLFFFLTHLSIG